jgi:hypothetical protein
MHRFVHVTIRIHEFTVFDPQTLDPAASSVAEDWIRYTSGTWILWSSRNLPEITNAFRAYLPEEAHILGLTIAMHDIPSGYWPQWVWDWLNRFRDPATGYVNFPPAAMAPPPTLPPPRNLFPPKPTALGSILAGLGGAQPPKKP